MQKREHLLLRKPSAVVFQVRAQRHSIHILHDHIGCFIGKEEIPHRHDAVQIIKFRQVLRLRHEFFQSLAIVVPARAGKGGYGTASPLSGFAGSKAHGEIFLDRHPYLQVQVPAHIGDAEAALSDDLPDHDLALQHSIEREPSGRPLVFVPDKAAYRAGLVRLCPFVHASRTKPARVFHDFPPFRSASTLRNARRIFDSALRSQDWEMRYQAHFPILSSLFIPDGIFHLQLR